MGFPLLPLILIAVVITIFIAKKIYFSQRFYKLAEKLPGPTPWPIVGNMYRDAHPDPSRFLQGMIRTLDKCDGFGRVWVGPYLVLLISRPEDLDVFFQSAKLLDKSILYKYFEPLLGKGLFTNNGDSWKKARKNIAPTFSPAVLRNFVKVFVKQANLLAQVVEKEVGKQFNMAPYLMDCTFAMICESALDFDTKIQTDPHPIREHLENLGWLSYERLFNPLEHPELIYMFTPNGRKFERLNKEYRAYIKNILDTKREEFYQMRVQNMEEHETRNTFIYKLLDDVTLSEDYQIDEVTTIISTGFDTSAATLVFCLLMLGMHPEIQDRVYEETLLVYEKLHGRMIEAEDLNNFEYLEMVLKETLRLFPIAPVIGRRAAEDIKFGDYIAPKGIDIACVMLRTNRDPTLYPNPMKFDPDRFLPENIDSRHRFAYVPFSAGPRGCIGTKYAFMSMKLIIGTLLMNYKIVCNKTVEDIKLRGEITLKCEGGCEIVLERRHQGKLILGNIN